MDKIIFLQIYQKFQQGILDLIKSYIYNKNAAEIDEILFEAYNISQES